MTNKDLALTLINIYHNTYARPEFVTKVMEFDASINSYKAELYWYLMDEMYMETKYAQ